MTDVDHPNDAPEQTGANPDAPTDRLLDEVARKQARKLRSRAVGKPDLLRGFGASGMVGWSITIPTLIGIALGIWLDRRYTQSFSWTLTLMAIGLVVGSLTAWYWVMKESQGD